MKKQGDIDTFCNEHGLYQDTATNRQIRGPNSISLGLHQPPPLSASNALQCFEKQYSHYINKVGTSSDGDKEKEEIDLSLSSMNVLKCDLTEFRSCNRELVRVREESTGVDNPKLSTDQIIRLAGERFIEFSSHMFININARMHPYGSHLAGLTAHDKLDVELVQLLLTVAEKVSHKQTDRACRLLTNCKKLASNTGTPVQRAVFYFAEALSMKIETETGKIVSSVSKEKTSDDPKITSKLKHFNTILAAYQKLPFPQAMQFAGVQVILENIKMYSKVHLIDIQMRIGATWAVLMQTITKQQGYKVKQLKLTVIVTTDKEPVETACTRLQNFEKTLNLMFAYHIILLSDINDLRDDQFGVEPGEVVVAHAPFVLRSMIATPICMEKLVNTMKRLNPSVMVITEVEANHNSPSFVHRFIEAFFYYGSFFDCLEHCMERNDQDRMDVEALMLRQGIHNIVATEGIERVTRSVKSEVWRAFLERFGMVEEELSKSSLYQAQLVLQTFPCVNSCSLEKEGKRLSCGMEGNSNLYSFCLKVQLIH